MTGEKVNSIIKGIAIIVRRLRTQGLWVTLQWLWGRGLPFVTGVPLARFSQITPQIWVGPQYRRWGKRALERQGLTAGVNLRIEYDDAAHGLALANYCHLPTVDDAAIAPEHFDKGVNFIREQVAQDGKVYIHCKAGVGRAPTLAAAYFIAAGMTTDAAVDLIKQARPFITITLPQMAALRGYEARQQG